MRRADAQLGDLLEEVDVGVEEEAQSGGERVDRQPCLEGQFDVGEAVGQGERQLFSGGGARFADVVAGDRDRVPTRHLRGGERDRVAHESHRLTWWEHELLLGLVLLQDVVLQRAAEPSAVHAGLLGLGDEHREDRRRRAVDRHRGGDAAEVDAGVEVLHVGERVDGDTAASDLAERHRIVGVESEQGRHVECGRQAVAARLDDLLEPPVGVLGGAEPGEHAHRPQPRAVHRRIRASGVRVHAGELAVVGAVDRLERDTRHRREATRP